ncbi:MAG: AAA family ATPase [Bdellovibrionales bacterium]|nr:AAA family ATPase [Bdellovibrionales bacterium]
MSLEGIANSIKDLNKNIVLVYAFNTTGKTRLSTAFKDATKDEDGKHMGVYYNAYSEDLFVWDNDIENNEGNVQLTIKESSLNRLHASFTEEEVMKKLEQYKPRYNFFFKVHEDSQKGFEAISFHLQGNTEQKIKISRGEERIFVWCLFLTMFEVEGWADEQNAHFFIDDPVSSLDDHNIFITASTLYELIEKHYEHRKIIITTHHIGLYSILSNWLTKGEKADKYKSKTKQFILNRKEETLTLDPIKNSVFLYHLHLLQTLDKAIQENELVSFHFALLRQVLENIASFLGVGQFSYVLKQIGIEDEGEIAKILNVLAHEKVYRYQTEKMTPDNDSLFKDIFEKLKDKYQFVLRTE